MTARPSVHNPMTKSYAIDQIDDIEHLRKVAHRMWEAFFAAHNMLTHTFDLNCKPCLKARRRCDSAYACDQWKTWQKTVNDGFGSV